MRAYVSRSGSASPDRGCHAVCHLVVVEDRATAGRPSHDVDVRGADLVDVVQARRRLMSAERQRRARPCVDAEHGFTRPRRAGLKGAVPRHVLGARTRRGEEKAPAAVTSRGVHRVLNCHLYEHHNQARRSRDSSR